MYGIYRHVGRGYGYKVGYQYPVVSQGSLKGFQIRHVRHFRAVRKLDRVARRVHFKELVSLSGIRVRGIGKSDERGGSRLSVTGRQGERDVGAVDGNLVYLYPVLQIVGELQGHQIGGGSADAPNRAAYEGNFKVVGIRRGGVHGHGGDGVELGLGEYPVTESFVGVGIELGQFQGYQKPRIGCRYGHAGGLQVVGVRSLRLVYRGGRTPYKRRVYYPVVENVVQGLRGYGLRGGLIVGRLGFRLGGYLDFTGRGLGGVRNQFRPVPFPPTRFHRY